MPFPTLSSQFKPFSFALPLKQSSDFAINSSEKRISEIPSMHLLFFPTANLVCLPRIEWWNMAKSNCMLFPAICMWKGDKLHGWGSMFTKAGWQRHKRMLDS